METIMGYNKVLVAQHSPQNRCLAEDGEWLIIAQEEHSMKGKLPRDHHFFIGLKSQRPSRYGWVKNVDYEISPMDLAKQYTKDPSESFVKSCQLLLESASKHEQGTPMACTYSIIGILEKKRIQKVHKIFFQK